MSQTLLIAEDEQVLRESLAELFRGEGFEVLEAPDGKAAADILLHRPADVVISDIRMPLMDGLALLAHIQKLAPETPVIMLTAYGTVETAVSAMRAGAVDYLLKPVDFNDVLAKVRRALDFREIARANRVITERLAEESTFHDLVGHAPSMNSLFDMVRKLSTVRSNVLLIGESGTGKELFARAIHCNGLTRDKPFIAVNSGAIPDSLFEAANGGTLFLDEISTLPLNVQSSLLRVLEERVVVPVGDTHARPILVRIIAASNHDLDKMVQDGQFREDLLFRLNVVKLQLPPLRQRKEDIPALVHHFMTKYTAELGKTIKGITNGAMRALLNHEWRGNVRELENVIERAIIFADGRHIGVEDLPFETAGISNDVTEDLKEALAQFERQHILYSLRRHNYDKAETARSLNIGISSLYRKLEELNIPKSMTEAPTETATT
jgi:DNA-binding NtrC family response regulator